MSFLASFRSDQILGQLIAESDPSSAAANKLVDKLKSAGTRAIPKIIDALALSDKTHTMVLVDILGAIVNDKNLELYMEGLADGNERVVSGTAWALSGSTDYNANGLLQFFEEPEVSKAALIEILRVHKDDLSVHELLRRAYDCEPKEKAAIFKIIRETIKPDMVPDLIALRRIELRLLVASEDWDPPGGTFDPDVLVQPGAFSNVENGFGFFGGGFTVSERWTPNIDLLRTIGYTFEAPCAFGPQDIPACQLPPEPCFDKE